MISQSSAVAERWVPNLRCRIYLIIRGGRAAVCGTLLRKTAPQSVTAARGQHGRFRARTARLGTNKYVVCLYVLLLREYTSELRS